MLMASPGKITAHNLHLLQDDQDDTPGGGGEGSPIMPEDDLNLRTATADSRSSADSRKMDESPVDDELGASPANLSEEARYQEELKERVKKSFADLGMEAEGVLLKDSLEDTPRDSIEIKEDLPYEEPPQGEYDARRKTVGNIENDVDDDDDEIDPEEELGGEGYDHEDGQEHPLNDRTQENDDDNGDDNFLADSLEADTADHQEQPDNNTGIENVPLHPDDDNLQENYDVSPEYGDRDEPNGQDEEGDNFVRDSLEMDRAESELHNLNDSNPISLGVTEQDSFDGDASDSFPTPVNQGDPEDENPEEQFPHLSKPSELEDRDEEAHPTQEGEDAENNHGEDENYNGIENANAPSEHEYGDKERTFSGNGDAEFDDGNGNSEIQNKPHAHIGERDSTPLGNDDDERRTPSLAAADVLSDGNGLRDSLDDDTSANEKPISSESRQSESRVKSASTRNGSPSNINNNAKGPRDRPPSGGSAHSICSNLNSRQRDPTVVSSPTNRTPVRSRDNSRERGKSSKSRQASTERVSSATSRPQSGARDGSSNREQASRNSDSREGQNSRRGSNDINIPRYSRKGMTNSDVENESSRGDLRNTESRERTARSGSSRSERTLTGSGNLRKAEQVSEPNNAPSALKPPPGPARTSPNDPRARGRPDSKGKKPSPRDFMTPGQKVEVEENKQFWSEMHQAGVFNQPVNPSAKARAEQVEKLKSGEKVRVEYISDDSGDEDLHFVDEKGSPIDQLGRPLFAAKTPETPDMRIMYRIKPSPPQQKPIKKSSSGRQRTRDVSAADSSRYGSGYSTRNGSGNRSGRQGSRIPVKQLVDRQVSPIEDEISPVETQQEGILDSTIPPAPLQQQSSRERPVKSACLQTGLDDVPSSEDVQESDFKSPIQEASIQTEEREIAIQPSEEHMTGNNDNSLPYQSPLQSPRNSRGEGPFGQVRVAPYQQQSPGYQQPSPGYNQPGQMQFPAGAYAQQVPMNYPSNPQAHWQPVIGPGYPNQSQQFAAPLQPQFVNPMMSPGMNQQMPQQPMQNYPGPQYHPQMQDPMQQVPYQQHMQQPPQPHPHPRIHYQYPPETHGPMGSPGRPFPGQEMEQPYPNDMRDAPDQPERKRSHEPRKQQPKPRHNFIDLNKTSAKLRRDPPNKKYTEALNQKKGYKSPMNPRKPLPQISRENSLDDGQTSSTGWTPHGSATSRSNDQWAHAVLREQQMIMLARGMSDPNIYPQAQVPPPAPMRNGSVPGNYAGGNTYQGGYPTPVTNPNQVNGQPYSWSADRANTYARMNAVQNGNQAAMGGPLNMDPRGSFEMNQTSPRQRMAYTHPIPSRTSPFQVLPDIHGSGRRSGEDSELRTSDPDGYLVKLQKQKQGPQYKPYTLKDFQNLKKDFKLGGLGPDKETMDVRNDKVARQREYARQVMEQNKKTIRHSPKAGTPQGKDSPQTEASKRELMLAYADSVPLPRIRDNKSPGDVSPRDPRSVALEYAKQIPKPRVPTPPEVLHDRLYGSGANSRQSEAGSRGSSVREDSAGSHEENTALEMARLQELTQRHKQEKDELDRLRKGVST